MIVLNDVVRRRKTTLPRHIEDAVHAERDLVSEWGEIRVCEGWPISKDEAALTSVTILESPERRSIEFLDDHRFDQPEIGHKRTHLCPPSLATRWRICRWASRLPAMWARRCSAAVRVRPTW